LFIADSGTHIKEDSGNGITVHRTPPPPRLLPLGSVYSGGALRGELGGKVFNSGP